VLRLDNFIGMSTENRKLLIINEKHVTFPFADVNDSGTSCVWISMTNKNGALHKK